MAQYGGDFAPPPDPRRQKKKPIEPREDDGPREEPAPTDGGTGDLRREGRKVLALPVPGEGPATPGESGWAIVLETFKGRHASASAQQRLPEVAALLGRQDVRIRVREKGCAIVLGAYASPEDERAQRDLAMVRAKEIALPGGPATRPYERAFLAAPSVTDRGLLPEFDLSNQRRRLGNRPAYTVQVAVYDTPDKPEEAKRAAEKAAKVLRDAGEKAFYYHGPRRSVVTIGLFSGRDVDEKTGRPRSPEIARIRREYPLNLLNGQYPIVIGSTGSGGVKQAVHQPSQLVKIP